MTTVLLGAGNSLPIRYDIAAAGIRLFVFVEASSPVHAFVTDAVGYPRMLAGEPFDNYGPQETSVAHQFTFDAPVPGPYWLVLSNTTDEPIAVYYKGRF